MTEDMIIPTEVELSNDVISKFYEAFNESFNESPMGDFIFRALRNGQKEIYNKSVRETRIFDQNFLIVMKSAYQCLAKICKDPKKALKYDQEVVAIEKAKKIDTDSIRHLASHTHLIKNVDDEGNVTPSKILTTFSEDRYDIYENVFIKTLINRICRYLDDRIKLLKENFKSIQADVIRYKNKANINGTELEVDFSIRVGNEIEEDLKKAKRLIQELETCGNLFKSLKASVLYQEVQKARDVVPPIMKTNIILHNPDFKVAYNTWLFLDKNTQIGFDVDTKERKHNDSEKIALNLDKLGTIALAQIIALRGLEGYNFEIPQAYRKNQYTRTVESTDTEYILTPKNIKLANQEVSELLLTKMASYFEEALDEDLEKGMRYEMSIKNVYKELLNIINHIYPTFSSRNPILEDKATKDEIKVQILKNELKVAKQIISVKRADLVKMQRELDRNQRKLDKMILKMKSKKNPKRTQKIIKVANVKKD